MKTLKLAVAGAISVACMMQVAHAQTVVTSFADSSNTDLRVWYQNDVRTGGAATIEDLTGLGGNLENNQPLPVGAAKLVTDFTDAAKAEVGVGDFYGTPGDIFESLTISYDYLKAANAGQAAAPAPSLKLAFLLQPCPPDEDCYGELIYEPYWNQTTPGVSEDPAVDTWTTVSIDQNNGVFWNTGMFGVSSSFGGPPLHTLADWMTTMNANFSAATLIRVSVGVGSNNQGQIGYFDDVRIDHAAYSAWYDFDVEGADGTAARFNVVKNFSDGRSDASNVTLTCNGGLPLEQTFSLPAGDPQGVTFTLTDFVEGETRCEVTDAGSIEGYLASFNNGTVTNTQSCVFEEVASGDYSCEIYSELQSVEFLVNLDWQVEEGAIQGPTTVRFDWFCENFRDGPAGNLLSNEGFFELSSDVPQAFGIFFPNYTTPETRCRFDTTATSSAVTLDEGCSDWVTMSPGQEQVSCTVGATIFFEGIPTLGQYGQALLVLLMLGMGIVGIRRSA